MEKWSGTNSLQCTPMAEVFPKSHSPYKGDKWSEMNKMWAQQVVHCSARLNMASVSDCFLLLGWWMHWALIKLLENKCLSILAWLQMISCEETDVWNLSTSGQKKIPSVWLDIIQMGCNLLPFSKDLGDIVDISQTGEHTAVTVKNCRERWSNICGCISQRYNPPLEHCSQL